jgi:hypothetical protein
MTQINKCNVMWLGAEFPASKGTLAEFLKPDHLSFLLSQPSALTNIDVIAAFTSSTLVMTSRSYAGVGTGLIGSGSSKLTWSISPLAWASINAFASVR